MNVVFFCDGLRVYNKERAILRGTIMFARIGFLLSVGLFFSFNTARSAALNMDDYLKCADGNYVYPSARQIQMLKSFIPDNSFHPAPPISDRGYWDKIAASESGKNWLGGALLVLDKKPEIPISDEVYRQANKAGNRGMYKPKYYDTMDRLEQYMLAECMENKGRFLPQINVYLRAIMNMKSWMHPNHDDKDNSVLEGKRMAIDLGARKFGSDLALAEVLLGDKLPGDIRMEISAQLRRRIIDSYLKSCRGDNSGNSWIKGSNNWNSVCTSGSLFVVIAVSNDADERLAAVGCALNSMKYYLAGFGSDGYCSEGMGYWGYGFGHYMYLAQILLDYSQGQIDLFKFDNPEKLKKIGNFPEYFQIQNDIYPAFSDASVTGGSDNFPKIMAAKYYGAQSPFSYTKMQAVEQLILWSAPDTIVSGKAPVLQGASYFDDYGITVSRGKQQDVPFSIAIKAGNNAENHNHDDIGSYSLILGEDLMTGDLGKPAYIAGAFDKDNKARCSWGHPVPRIDTKLQSNGRAFFGTIVEKEFTKDVDRVVMDIKTAYEVPSLITLTRTMKNNKSGAGTIEVQDQFSSSVPIAFGTAIMTYAKYEIMDSNTIILAAKNQKVKAEIISEGAPVKIVTEPVPVRLSSGMTGYRIGIDFAEPIRKGLIAVRYTPVLEKGRD